MSSSFIHGSKDIDINPLNNKNKEFYAIFHIKNLHKEGWVSNGVRFDLFNKTGEIIYPAFSIFYVEKVEINMGGKYAEIYLETIGKKEILEEGIIIGKEIVFSPKENIMKLKNKS